MYRFLIFYTLKSYKLNINIIHTMKELCIIHLHKQTITICSINKSPNVNILAHVLHSNIKVCRLY